MLVIDSNIVEIVAQRDQAGKPDRAVLHSEPVSDVVHLPSRVLYDVIRRMKEEADVFASGVTEENSNRDSSHLDYRKSALDPITSDSESRKLDTTERPLRPPRAVLRLVLDET